ncbi:MAG: hypothetical protein GY953_28205 [bacterium]|nr:hypothetical protein [bacterium]
MRVRIPVWTQSPQQLSQEEIVATVDGAPARILRLQNPSDDLMLLVVLDLVGDLNEIDLAREALLATVVELPVNAYVGILRAQDGLQVVLDPTTDRDAAIAAIEGFSVSGTPGLLETVETASSLADSILAKSPVRIAICYVTDSNIYEYREDFTNPVINYSDRRDLSRRFPEGLVRDRIAKLKANLASRQAPIFIVHVERQRDRLNEAYQNGLMELASVTGGSSVFCGSNAEIATAVEQTFRTIATHYGLDLQVAGKLGAQVEIVLESENGELNYRNRYLVKKR